MDLCGDRMGSCSLGNLQGQNLGDRSPEVSSKQNTGNRTGQERGCQQGGIGGKASEPIPQASPRTLPYKAYLCPCPPGFSLLYPAASCLWAHTRTKSSGFPHPLPLGLLSVISWAPGSQEPILGGPALSSHLPMFLCFKRYISPSCSWREKHRLQRPSKWFL